MIRKPCLARPLLLRCRHALRPRSSAPAAQAPQAMAAEPAVLAEDADDRRAADRERGNNKATLGTMGRRTENWGRASAVETSRAARY